ncbi:hypothetical protein [Lachnoclostridium sp. Marseille-P6806]|uniref:hypothetical protein n=1 Tax=Lachnoclostridium sp. Marseille-P6806 TaxID=2364793 RepID=UPI001031AF0A|nr:hypothetical protein [Lachnoclostridium sp. Marseille-P6806]
MDRFFRHSRSIHFRLSAALCALGAAAFLSAPSGSVYAAAGAEGKVTAVSAPAVREYHFPVGTSLESMGLPARLNITMTTDKGAEIQSVSEVDWKGYYDAGTAGSYWLDCELPDASEGGSPCAAALDMPVIRVILSDATQITRVASPAASSYVRRLGSDIEEITALFPERLNVVFTTKSGGVTSTNEVTEEVNWVCRGYQPNRAGDYRFTAVFTDEGLRFSAMPSIIVTLR